MTVKVVRVLLGDAHLDTKWVVLEGSIDGCPQATKRRTINSAALASGHLTLTNERDALVSDVLEYHARYRAIEEALREL